MSLNQRIEAAFSAGEIPKLHAVYASHRGEVIAEAYFDGEDEIWGRPLGHRSFDAETLHDVRSISKSVVSLLYGIALERGVVPSLDSPLVEAFPQYGDLAADTERQKITLRYALSMTMGLAWDETVPYDSLKNSEVAMEHAPDRYRYVMEQPVVEPPGATWNYSGGAAALVGKVIEEGTGQALDEFAKTALFDPLGITRWEWMRGDDNVPAAASGLRMTLPDLAKLGDLIVAGGASGGRSVVPSRWLDDAFTAHAYEPTGLGYGYYWWLSHPFLLSRWVAAFGNGGQRLFVHPEDEVVVAIFGGRYNDFEAYLLGMTLLSRFIYPEVRARMKGTAP
ncbi:MAG: serine hydrolase domain-containing protein [Pseudomonadota bacterium]